MKNQKHKILLQLQKEKPRILEIFAKKVSNGLYELLYPNLFKRGKNTIQLPYSCIWGQKPIDINCLFSLKTELFYRYLSETLKDGFKIIDGTFIVLDMDPKKQIRKIGRVLNQILSISKMKQGKKEKIMNSFIRYTQKISLNVKYYIESQKRLKIIISKQPYDILTMSTNKKYTSCLSLEYKTNSVFFDINSRHAYGAIINGGLVAYLMPIDSDDINHAISRIMILPYSIDSMCNKFFHYPVTGGFSIDGKTNNISSFIHSKSAKQVSENLNKYAILIPNRKQYTYAYEVLPYDLNFQKIVERYLWDNHNKYITQNYSPSKKINRPPDGTFYIQNEFGIQGKRTAPPFYNIEDIARMDIEKILENPEEHISNEQFQKKLFVDFTFNDIMKLYNKLNNTEDFECMLLEILNNKQIQKESNILRRALKFIQICFGNNILSNNFEQGFIVLICNSLSILDNLNNDLFNVMNDLILFLFDEKKFPKRLATDLGYFFAAT